MSSFSLNSLNSLNKYKDKGLTGLVNLGNTCFINSCIQILSHTYEFNDFLNSKTYTNKLNNKYESSLLIEWDNLRNLMWNNNCVIVPAKFIKTIQKLAKIKGVDIFTGYSQNDISEFFLFIMDCFHIALMREVTINIHGTPTCDTDKIAIICFEMMKKMYSKEYSEIVSIFYGIHLSQIISLQDNTVLTMNAEPYFMIDLPIPDDKKEINIYDCFDLYVKGEVLQNDNAWFNETLGEKQDVIKKITFWNFPTILAIDLKRFCNTDKKNQRLITFPIENLDLTKYAIGYKQNKFIYDLYGVANHSGNVLGGHYTAYIKNANGKWYLFNDNVVSEIDDLNKIISQKAYCLFYRLRL